MKKTLSFLIILQIIPAISLAGTIEDSVKLKQAREKMIAVQIQRRGISDPAVLAAMSDVLRHHFVPDELVSQAYSDHPLPIGEGQTISQPYIVALMTESLNLTKHDRVLEIGTGSGYQAAVLAKIVKEVYTIEIKQKLYKITSKRLSSLGFTNIETLHGDGYFGWQEKAPFDAIMITAAVNHIPPPLLRQLNKGGRLILPMGHPFSVQNLVLVTKRGDDIIQKQITGVLFVPMTGFALER